MPLTQEEITALLHKELEKPNKRAGLTEKPPQARPRQIGPLRWYDKQGRCSSRGCGSPTYIRVMGAPYCTTHALYMLNKLLLSYDPAPFYEDCTCKAGEMSKQNLHTEDCAIYERIV